MTLNELRDWIAGKPAPPPPEPDIPPPSPDWSNGRDFNPLTPDRDGLPRVVLTSEPREDGTVAVHVDFINATNSALSAMNLYADAAPILQGLVRAEVTRRQPEPATTFVDAARNAGRAG